MDLYRELILDHYKNPRNFGHLEKPDIKMEENNVSCGDRISIELTLNHVRRATSIKDIRFSGDGCAISQASASLLTEKAKGMNTQDVLKLRTEDVLEMLGTTLTPSRIKCALLSLEVLQKAIMQAPNT